MMTAEDDMERQKFALRELFRSYNTADTETVKAQVRLIANPPLRVIIRGSWHRA